MTSKLLQPHSIRELKLRNRMVLSPMAMYISDEGFVNQFHLTHYQKFAMGGMGLVMVEQTAVSRRGRITNGCLGLWNDSQIKGMQELVSGIHYFGAKAGIQINHGGRKASAQRAWKGNGVLTEEDEAAGEERWTPHGPSDVPFAEGWPKPEAMSLKDIEKLKNDFLNTANRALEAGFDLIEIHMAHGYLLQSFLSPIANHRKDQYGGSLENRMRLPLEVAAKLRSAWPADKPVFARISATDWIEGGWTIDDSIVLSQRLKQIGVDLVDCSSGGNLVRGATNSSLKRGPGYQVPFAEQIKRATGIATMAVGMIHTGAQAEKILQEDQCDLIAIGRQALFDPFWALHAERTLKGEDEFDSWPSPYGWWLNKWAPNVKEYINNPNL